MNLGLVELMQFQGKRSLRENASTKDQVVTQVHQWNERKKQFIPRQIALAYDVLHEKGWLKETEPGSITWQ